MFLNQALCLFSEQVRAEGRLSLPEAGPAPEHVLLPAPALQRTEAGEVFGQGEDDHLQPFQVGRLLQGTFAHLIAKLKNVMRVSRVEIKAF